MLIHYATDAPLPPGKNSLEKSSSCIDIDVAGRGWRLNSASLADEARARNGDAYEALIARAIGECRPWDQATRRLLACYFAWVSDRVEAERLSLERILEPCSGLFAPQDFRYSAPCPLPRAHLPIASASGAREFFHADVVFFPGGGRIVAFLQRGQKSPPRDAKARQGLIGIGAEVFNFDEASAETFTHIITPIEPFWAGEILPCGPLRPAALR